MHDLLCRHAAGLSAQDSTAYLPVVTLAFMSGTKMWNWKPVAEGLCDIKVGSLLALGLNLFFILSSPILSLLCLMGIA